MQRNILLNAAARALKEAGFAPERLPGRGLSSVWEIEEAGQRKRVAVRTTKDRWLAFPPREGGTKWKTLDDVDIVVVATLNNRNNPQNIEVYRFDAEEVRRRFNQSHAARLDAGQKIWDNHGLWINLDRDDRELTISVGSGLAADYPPFATFPLADLLAKAAPAPSPLALRESDAPDTPSPRTIAEVMDWARRRIAALSGVDPDSVKLNCHIQTPPLPFPAKDG